MHNPTLEDFLRRARQEFQFLIPEFGFQEWALPRRDVNEFQVRYRSATTLVHVEGINWGYGVNVLLGRRRWPSFRRNVMFPLWAIVKLRRPDLYDNLAPGDQLDQISSHAAALRACAEDVLRGGFGVHAEVRKLIQDIADANRGR